MVTYAAPAECLSPAEVASAIARLGGLGPLRAALDLVPDYVLLLSPQRQILHGNAAWARLADELGQMPFLGRRLGEVLACRNASSAPGGCGTGEGCRTCGSLHAILLALHGRPTTVECRILDIRGRAYDLRVAAAPFAWQGEEYVLAILGDISATKRREVLERVFFHDVLNSAGGVAGLAAVMADNAALYASLKDDLATSADGLVHEIRSQQQLMGAEAGVLQLDLAPVTAAAVLEAVRATYHAHPVGAGRTIRVASAAATWSLTTDRVLLQRTLGNLVKNALEAVPSGAVVELGADADGDEVAFWVHNPGFIPREAQLQLFQRSFSTKGRGRGLGTYSVKLFGEQHLGGHVSFTSTPAEGTRFVVRLPRDGPRRVVAT